MDEFVRLLKKRIDEDPELTPAGLAKRSGLDNSAIRSLISGRAKSPKFSTVMKIMDGLGTTLEEFMGNSRTPAELRILGLVSQLSVEQRMQLLGYAKALRDARDLNTEDPEENQ